MSTCELSLVKKITMKQDLLDKDSSPKTEDLKVELRLQEGGLGQSKFRLNMVQNLGDQTELSKHSELLGVIIQTTDKVDTERVSESEQKLESSSNDEILEKFENKANSGKNGAKTGRKRRRTKDDPENKNYTCEICMKAYFSYPALYTHKRNKHNIIPITGKENLFKNENMKFKYSALEMGTCNFKDMLSKIIDQYGSILRNFYTNTNCILFQQNFNESEHVGIQILKKMQERKVEKILVPHPDTHPCIDEILIIYLVYFVKITQDQLFIDMVIKFVILLREYINVVGWDYKKKFRDFGIKMRYKCQGPYTLYNGCEEIPDYINNFVSIFMQMDPTFHIESDQLLDLCKNFCNWLFVNNLTSFKICTNEFDNED